MPVMVERFYSDIRKQQIELAIWYTIYTYICGIHISCVDITVCINIPSVVWMRGTSRDWSSREGAQIPREGSKKTKRMWRVVLPCAVKGQPCLVSSSYLCPSPSEQGAVALQAVAGHTNLVWG